MTNHSFSENETKNKRQKKHGKLKIKEECKRKKIKKEKQDRIDHSKSSRKSKDPDKDKMDEQNLMSVLELLELQARARAIRSQLALENSRKTQEQEKNNANVAKIEESDNEDAIIIESPKNIEIIITSSESENDDSGKSGLERRKSNSAYKDNYNGNENATKEISYSAKEKQVKSDTEDKERNQLEQTDKETEGEGSCGNKDMEIKDKPSGDKNCRAKITNVETFIITPPKNSMTSINDEKDKESKNKNRLNKQKSKDSESESDKEKIKNNKPKNKVEHDSNQTEIHKTQTTVADEGDGIIINMEQSEIDCIISD